MSRTRMWQRRTATIAFALAIFAPVGLLRPPQHDSCSHLKLANISDQGDLRVTGAVSRHVPLTVPARREIQCYATQSVR